MLPLLEHSCWTLELYSFAVQALPLGAMHSARLLTSHRGAICARSLVQAQTRLRLIIIKRQARRRSNPCFSSQSNGRLRNLYRKHVSRCTARCSTQSCITFRGWRSSKAYQVFGTLHSKAPLILTERGENFLAFLALFALSSRNAYAIWNIYRKHAERGANADAKGGVRTPEIPLRLRLALFPPCHPEQRRNPSETRIERCVASFGISAEKVRLRLRSAQNDTGGANADGKGVLNAKLNKNVVLIVTHSLRYRARDILKIKHY